MVARVEIPVGARFGKLVVLGEGESRVYGKQRPTRTLRCRCDCGNIVDVSVRSLLHHDRQYCSRSCAKTVHGMATRANREPIYNCWQSMMARCENPKATGYMNWGGRTQPITVYGPWHDPAVYKADVEREIGPRPGLDWTIDRINNDQGYRPGNIRWQTKADQPRNRRPVYNSTEVAEMFAVMLAEALAQHHCPGCQCSR
jgi:hypothetical protein